MQPDLFSSSSPAVSSSEVERLMFQLRGFGWCTAKQMAFVGNERRLRVLASASKGRIISGQKGYCLIEEATVEEANHAAAWLEHQAKAMAQRASEIRRAMHKRHSTEAA